MGTLSLLHGDRLRKFWEKKITGRSIITGKWIQDLEKILVEEKIKTLLEIGSGYGTNLRHIKKIYPEIHCIGTEIAQHCIDKSEKYRANNGEEYFWHDARNVLPLESKRIDLILCTGLLMHIPDENINLLVKEIKRVAKKVVFIYEKEGNGNGNGYVFFHNYDKLFNLEKIIEKKWERNMVSIAYRIGETKK